MQLKDSNLINKVKLGEHNPLIDSEFKKIIFDKTNDLIIFQPIVSSSNKIEAFEVVSSLESKSIYDYKTSEKNMFLYEMRGVFTALEMIKIHEHKYFMMEVRLSKFSLINPMMINYLSNHFPSLQCYNRIIFSFDDLLLEDEEVVKNLRILKNLKFKIMAIGEQRFSYSKHIEVCDFIKLNISNINNMVFLKMMINSAIEFKKLMEINVIFGTVDNQESYDLLSIQGVDYMQGLAVEKGKRALVSSKVII